MVGTAIDYAKCIWGIFNGPNNQPIIIALILGGFALFSSHVFMFFSYRARLNDKDAEIKRLVDERNKLQDYLLKQKGTQRLTTKPTASKKKEGK